MKSSRRNIKLSWIRLRVLLKLQAKCLNVKETLRKKDGEALRVQKNKESFIKLNKLELPSFNGKYEDWQSFHDFFITSVEKNSVLSSAQKLQYLKGALKDEASDLLSAFQITDANYKPAWDTLVARYDNKRQLLQSLLKKLFGSSTMQRESAIDMRKIADNVQESIRALKVLGRPVEHWDDFIVYFSAKKLDIESKREWALKQTDFPTVTEFVTFIEKRAIAISASTSDDKNRTKSNSKIASHHGSLKPPCVQCKDDHPLFKCKNFISLSIPERELVVKKNKLCFNCLMGGHAVDKCVSKHKCKHCDKRHSSLLHKGRPIDMGGPVGGHQDRHLKDSDPNGHVGGHSSDQQRKPYTSPMARNNEASSNSIPESNKPVPTVSSNVSSCDQLVTPVVLATALVDCESYGGQNQVCRMFLDNGSEANFITEHCVDRLGLKRHYTDVAVSGIGSKPSERAKGYVFVKVKSRVYTYSLTMKAVILPKITGLLPKEKCEATWTHIQDLKLADPSFNVPGHVDLLLGAEFYDTITKRGKRQGPSGTPVAQNTRFGWIISGPVNMGGHQISVHHATVGLDAALKKFWELEDVGHIGGHPSNSTTEEDAECERHFVETHYRNPDGRYVVHLPFRKDAPPLGSSYMYALKRFHQLERKFSRQPLLRDQYVTAMKDSISAGHMELVPNNEIDKPDSESYYIPHHGVIKDSSSTTKLRVVYDASAKTSTGFSLNDVLMTGPKIQEDLAPIMIRWCSHVFAMSADIKQMYLQFLVDKKDVDYQRILWRESNDHPPKIYRLLRVTFGVTCAPFLAIRCLLQVAKDHDQIYPIGAQVTTQDYLVDNLLSGNCNVNDALKIQSESLGLMKCAKLELRKWSSNCSEILEAVIPDMRETKLPLCIDIDDSVKTLGIIWHPGPDTLSIKVDVPEEEQNTKREILSRIAKVFDPVGWVSPYVVRLKRFMQMLWKSEISWDHPLPQELQFQWKRCIGDLVKLEEIKIQRCTVLSKTVLPCSLSKDSVFELHGFCDASQLAYAACVYLRVVNSDKTVSLRLATSKTKVAPVKGETIPRLELCGALLLAELLMNVNEYLKMNFAMIRGWTDATVVLDWLNSKEKLPVFINNRVAKIKKLLPLEHWGHVSGSENPADCASRGVSAIALKDHPLWWTGPNWLLDVNWKPISYMGGHSPTDHEMTTPTIETSCHVVVTSSDLFSEFVSKCSSFSKMKRVVAYVLRFTRNSREKPKNRNLGHLTTHELKHALTEIVKCVQGETFQKELECCLEQKQVMSKPVKFLSPFLDVYGVLRVGGRLEKSALPFDQKHPILLPRKHNLTEVVLRHYHLTLLHGGPQLLLAAVRNQFWIIRGDEAAKQVVRRCLTCLKQKKATAEQVMGQLPSSRVTPALPFRDCGVDYAGPYMLCERVMRGNRKTFKHWIAVFVCFTTRAVHIELVNDLTTEAFIGALTRFIAKNNMCKNIYCDGGTNFKGAKNELAEFKKFVNSKEHNNKIGQTLADKDIVWHMSPPVAPHFGGLFEAAVKSMKYHLKRVIGEQVLTIEEMWTLLASVQSCLNSRPLSPMSSDPNDYSVLTPGHFLTGGTMECLQQPDLTHLPINRLSRWQATQQMFQHFWRRWSSDYLSRLQQRPKWISPQPNMKIGDMVLVRDEELAWGPLKWKLGRIVNTHPGDDGQVRVCEVKFNGKVYKRPIVKLSLLPFNQ